MRTIAKEEYEFTTRYLKQSKAGTYFTGVQNGGSKGSWQPHDQVNGNWAFWQEPLHAITNDEAEALADQMGVEL